MRKNLLFFIIITCINPLCAMDEIDLDILAQAADAAAREDLSNALFDEDPDRAKQIIKRHPNVVHHKDDNGETILHEFAPTGHHAILEFLLKNGANWSQINNAGATPAQILRDNNFDAVADTIERDIARGNL